MTNTPAEFPPITLGQKTLIKELFHIDMDSDLLSPTKDFIFKRIIPSSE